MKKVFTLLIGLFLLPLSIQAADFKEGTHYTVISQTVTEKPEVLEFFSFYCPHCFKFEPLIKTLKQNLPQEIKIKKNHVNFLGKEMGAKLTHAYAAAELLGIEDTVSTIIFNRLHTQRKAIVSDQDIIDIFVQAGATEAEAKSAMVSFPVNGIAAQMKRNTESYKIRGVPTLIVNGKYQVKSNSVKSEKEFVALVNYLATKDK